MGICACTRHHQVVVTDALDSARSRADVLPVADSSSHDEVVRGVLERVDVQRLVQTGEISNYAAVWCCWSAAKRLLVATEWNSDLAVTKLIEALRWRSHHQQLLEGSGPLASDIRCVGLDTEGCAIVYTCCANQSMQLSATIDLVIGELERVTTLLELRGGACSQIVYVYDVFGFSVMKNLNPTSMLRLLAPLDSYFAERVCKVIVVDMPRAAHFVWEVLAPLLPPKTRRKIVFTQRNEGLKMLAERCEGSDEDGPMLTLTRVRDAMSANRTRGSTISSRRHSWDGSTWRGDASHVAATTMGGGGMGNIGNREKELFALAERMEVARAGRFSGDAGGTTVAGPRTSSSVSTASDRADELLPSRLCQAATVSEESDRSLWRPCRGVFLFILLSVFLGYATLSQSAAAPAQQCIYDSVDGSRCD